MTNVTIIDLVTKLLELDESFVIPKWTIDHSDGNISIHVELLEKNKHD